MEYVTLQFASMQELWTFQKLAQLRNFEFNSLHCTLRAKLTQEEVWEALNKWGCKVFAQKETA